MDTSYNVASLSKAIDTVSGLVKSYDKIDVYVGTLKFVEAAKLLGSCYSEITSLTSDNELEEEIQVCCSSLRSKCLAEVLQSPSMPIGDRLTAELDRYAFNASFFKASGSSFDVANCNALYDSVQHDVNTNSDKVMYEALQLLHNLKSGWLNRYEVLTKLFLFLTDGWLNVSDNKRDDMNKLLFEAKGESQCITYSEFDDCLIILNMYDTYLRLIEELAERCIKPKLRVINKHETEDACSLDHVYGRVLGLCSNNTKEMSVEIEGFNNASEIVGSMIKEIAHLQVLLHRQVSLSDGGPACNGEESVSNDAYADYVGVDIKTFKYLSKTYERVFVDTLVSKLLCAVFPCWESEDGTLLGLLRSFNDFYWVVKNSELSTLDYSSCFVTDFFKHELKVMEEHALVFTRYCAKSQCDETILKNSGPSDASLSRDKCIRTVDKEKVVSLFSSLICSEISDIPLGDAIKSIQWINNIEESRVSNEVYSLAALLYVLAERPTTLMYHTTKILGVNVFPHKLAEMCIGKYSHMIDTVVTLYIVMTQDMFKQFVLGVTRVLIKDEDILELMQLKDTITMFLVFLSNVSFLANVSIMLPYVAQEMYNHVASSIDRSYKDKQCNTTVLSKVVKSHFHTCGCHVNLLKVQDYLLTQFAAFVQQVLQKLFSRLLNNLNDTVSSFGEEAVQLFRLIISECDQVLPKPLYSNAVALVVDLYYTTIPDLFLDYLDLLSYQPSDKVLDIITIFVVNIESMLANCLMDIKKEEKEMLYCGKFAIFAGVFKHDFSYMDDPNPPYNHRDLGRLSKLSKCIQSNVAQAYDN